MHTHPARASDDVVGVAKLCARLGVPHVINNAYGVQARGLCAMVSAAARRGRVDAVVQSTDKNFMVPVGGALVASPEGRPGLAAAVAKAYPGRASASPLIDLLATLLHWGAAGWEAELAAREALYGRLKEGLGRVAAALGERVLETPGNPISLAITVDGLARAAAGANEAGPAAAGAGPADAGAHGGGARGGSGDAAALSAAPAAAPRPLDVTFFGSMLWARGVSGTRVVAPGKAAKVAGLTFPDYGGHAAGGYPHTFVTAAAALGTRAADADEFCLRFVKAYREFERQAARRRRQRPGEGSGGSGVPGGDAAAEPSAE
jgi:O-phospho-L-seryl-tRNASec:L-selenocysteinyl-tRNA synthase